MIAPKYNNVFSSIRWFQIVRLNNEMNLYTQNVAARTAVERERRVAAKTGNGHVTNGNGRNGHDDHGHDHAHHDHHAHEHDEPHPEAAPPAI